MNQAATTGPSSRPIPSLKTDQPEVSKRKSPIQATCTDDYHKVETNIKVENVAAAPELPKVWSIEDPLQFAPPRPDGDPWTLLLEPLLKNDQKRCDSWRDEVQNLLIFAGLFSAVVTSFIIQSYQGLQEDPNSTMITLLSLIAARLDAPLAPNTNITTPTSQLPSIPIAPFSPTTSSIRVNALWFTSLVLSLTTVLVGTISLQWLREHQTYSDLTPREMYAVHHMRHQSLARWHVDKIFSTMPLLLQSALVLFLIGIFDFLQTFGYWAVTAPVAVLMGLSLIFLVATAVLPSVHTLSLYFNFSDEWNQAGSRGRAQGKGRYFEAPSPCPYKSPQSHAIRTIVGPLFSIFHTLYPHVWTLRSRTRKLARKAKRAIKKKWSRPSSTSVEEGQKEVVEDDFEDDEMSQAETFTRYLLFCSWTARWVEFDVSWLAIRDGFMRRAHGRGELFECIGSRDSEIAPVLDVVLGLSSQKNRKATFGAAYACFAEISEETLRPLRSRESRDMNNSYDDVRKRFHQSAYMHDILDLASGLTDVFHMEEVFLTSSDPDSNLRKNLETLHVLLHQQNLHAFMAGDYFSDGTLMSNHRKELTLRLSSYLYQSKIRLVSDVDSTTQPLADISFPSCLRFTLLDSEALFEPETERDAFNVITWQTSNLLLSIFQILGSAAPGDQRPSDNPTPACILLHPLMQRIGILDFLHTASYFTVQSVRFAAESHHEDDLLDTDTLQRGILAKIDETFSFVADGLRREIESWPTARGRGPSLLFYTAALYTNMMLPSDCWSKKTDSKIGEMIIVLRSYKRRTVDMGVVDLGVEGRLAEDETMWWESKKPFSELWWQEFEDTAANLAKRAAGDNGSERGDGESVRFGFDPERRKDDIVVFYPCDGSPNSDFFS